MQQSNSRKSLDLVATNSADKPTCTALYLLGGVLHPGATYDLVQPGKDAGQGDEDDDNDDDDDDDDEAGRRLTGSKAPLAFESDVPYVRVVTTESGSVSGGEVNDLLLLLGSL